MLLFSITLSLKDVITEEDDAETLKGAVKRVLKRYTFFDLETTIVHDLEGNKGALERLIINNYTEEVPKVLRKVCKL